MANEVLFWVWLVFHVVFFGLAFIFLFSGIDDLFFDMVYYWRAVKRWFLIRKGRIKPLTREQLNSVPEKWVAVMIPAWDESAVIAHMLLNTVGTLDYKNYQIFVGTYPNDEATLREVNKARDIYPNIQFIVTPASGPTNKSDCLNWIFQGILAFEKDHNMRFEFFVMQDSEDIVHPLSLKFYNFMIPRMDFVQLPVFPLEGRWWQLTVGTYMDEFAEFHTKDLRSRETLAGYLPSAGVGTAISRAAMDYLAGKHRNQIFDITTLTEDYKMGLQLRDFHGKKIFLQQTIERDATVKHWLTGKPVQRRINERVATRERFPDTFNAAVRQKARWILGISIQGWSLGWAGSAGGNYCLYRERKGLLTNLVTMLAYFVAIYWLLAMGLGWMNPSCALPPLADPYGPLILVMKVLLILLCWRMLNRMVMVWRIYRSAVHVILAPVRLIWGNVLNFCATCQAIKRYFVSRITGKIPEWGKTAHAWPTGDQLRAYHLKLGDLLLQHRLVSLAQLEEALSEQRDKGGRLGDILVKRGVLWEEDLVNALARQDQKEAVEIDYANTPAELFERVPREVAERFHVFPLSTGAQNGVVLATDRFDYEKMSQEVAKAIGCPASFKLCAAPDLKFAIERGYAGAARPRTGGGAGRIGEKLAKSGRLDEKALRDALRRQKRTGQRLGDTLVEMGHLTQEELQKELGS
jgi:adsorption protein B